MEALARLDWPRIAADLDAAGYATTGTLLTPDLCAHLSASYADASAFRKRIVMDRHGYGRGEYQYFAYPLPGLVQELRATLYPRLAPLANLWMERLGSPLRFPSAHGDFLDVCHAAGQERPTPLLLRYGAGDFNHLHQDLYGELHFPMQAVFLLDRPGEDFDGGEFVLTEQRPRMQSRVEVVPSTQGEAVIFAVNQRPVQGARGYSRVTMRHGVSRLRSGHRHTLGIIFHDAR